MWLVRPAETRDLEDILAIAGAQGPRLSSTLPRQRDSLAEKIELSRRSFAGQAGAEEFPRYLFVLEDSASSRVRGVAGIDARAGNGQPFYSYRRDALIHASHELGVSRRVEVLYPSHALTDQTLLCAFNIDPALRGNDAFELLSRARLLFMASHRDRFTRHTVVEIQGVQTEAGAVPFWDSLGRHFFDMDFETADHYSAALSKTFIAELMPPHPIYVTLLSEAAQQALGQFHPLARQTCELLLREGFHQGCYLDIFDAGPVLEAHTDSLKTIVTSQCRTLYSSPDEGNELCLVAAGEGGDFRCTLSRLSETLREEVRVPLETWECLGRGSGDPVRIAPL